jgi:hypothetical protein
MDIEKIKRWRNLFESCGEKLYLTDEEFKYLADNVINTNNPIDIKLAKEMIYGLLVNYKKTTDII